MGPAVKSSERSSRLVRPAPADEADVRAGIEEAERGDTVALSEEELNRWAETGEWPERLD